MARICHHNTLLSRNFYLYVNIVWPTTNRGGGVVTIPEVYGVREANGTRTSNVSKDDAILPSEQGKLDR